MEISSATAGVAPDLLKALGILSDTTVRRYAVDQEDLRRVLKKVFSNFALSDAEDNTSGTLNRGGIADLPLLRTLLAMCQKSQEPIFGDVMDSFVLLPYASLAASRTLVQPLLPCLNFTLEAEDLSFWYNWKKVP